MTTDTTRTVEIAGSPGKMILLVGLGVLMTVASAAIAFRWIPDLEADPATLFFGPVALFFGYVGLLFFGLCTIIIAWRLFNTRGPVVTIAPEGIRDTRVAAEFIPWSAVKSVDTWEFAGQRVVVLPVDPAVEGKLTLSRIARWSRGPNRALGADGLAVTAQGLKIDYDTLLATCQDYWQAHGRKA